MGDGITHVGLDAHQETIVAAVLLPGAQAPVELEALGGSGSAGPGPRPDARAGGGA